jgi:hypothetical protein
MIHVAWETAMKYHDEYRWIGTDYSEEAIPERDPAYRLPVGTVSETQTVEQITAAERLALAQCLEQLGMSRVRAAFVASL